MGNIKKSLNIFFILNLSVFLLAEHKLFSNQSKSEIVFVVLCHIRNDDDSKLWRRCHDSIREFYPGTPIVIIDDNSQNPPSDDSLDNVIFIKSEYPGAAEILPYHYFMKYKWAEKMIFLHDSMILIRPFGNYELSAPIKFHWHFATHWCDDDAMINCLLSRLDYAEELIDYNLNHKDLWYGCFGVASIIDLNLLEKIEQKYSIINSLKILLKTRSQRMALERIFALIMFKEQYVSKDNCSNFGIIHSHPYAYMDIDDDMLEEIKKSSYPSAIIKTWHGR